MSNWHVIWSPLGEKKFLKYSLNEGNSEILLYNMYNKEETLPDAVSKKLVVKLADNFFACPITRYFEFLSVKSIAWCPRKHLELNCMLAVGTSTGKVSLLSVQQSTNSASTAFRLKQEFTQRSERTCHELAWSGLEPNLLAVGLDRVRSECSLYVWDVEAHSASSPGMDNRQYASKQKPLIEYGPSEPTVSVRWFPNMPRTLVMGQGCKYLRLFDIRVPNPKTIANTRAVNGICVDNINPNRIASFAENTVFVWDMRHYEKPLVTLNQSNPVSKIEWCPTRNHILSVLHKDQPSIKCYNLQYSTESKPTGLDGDNDSIVFERSVKLPHSSQSTISSFGWNPTGENIVLTITDAGDLQMLKMYEKINMSWSPNLQLAWSCGKHIFMSTRDVNASEQFKRKEDISFVMRERAMAGYGEKKVFKDEQLLKKILRDASLCDLWSWLKRSRRLKECDGRKGRQFYGVKAITRGEMNISGHFMQSFIEEKTRDESVKLFSRQYSSADRSLALKLCGWDESDTNLRERLENLVLGGERERAAAMALFNNRLSQTIEILSSASSIPTNKNEMANNQNSDSSLPLVAMALSGYSEKKQPLWIANCKRLCGQLKNPYLRAMFSFLTTDDDGYVEVLKESGMKLEDRMAFACRYLSDGKLISYVEGMTMTLVSSGGLEGLLLTGLTPDGMELLENYITRTSDIQTVVLVILNIKVLGVFKDNRVNNWIENYRDLLDRWKLWHKRAQFDLLVQSAEGSRKIQQQISVSCTYCTKPVSYNVLSAGGMLGARYMGVNARQNKAISCHVCRQPLPRCSVCWVNMGSLSAHVQRSGNRPKLDHNVNPFLNWFTWCQMCRHGGHAIHLTEWFEDHVHCPVTGCNCTCNAHDSIATTTRQQPLSDEINH